MKPMAWGRIAVVAVMLVVALHRADAAIEMAQGGYLYAEHHEDLTNAEGGLTVEGWFYLNAFPEVERRREGEDRRRYLMPLLAKPGSYHIVLEPTFSDIEGDDEFEIDFSLYGGDDTGLCALSRARTAFRVPNPNPLRAKEWTHVAFEVAELADSTRYNVYFQGERITSRTLVECSRVWAMESRFAVGGIDVDEFRLGWIPRPARLYETPSWDGSIESVRISRGLRYDQRLFAPDRDLRADADTLAHWRFDAPAPRYEDLSGNGHTLFSGGTLPVRTEDALTTTWGSLKVKVVP